jgi:hypothetical protein
MMIKMNNKLRMLLTTDSFRMIVLSLLYHHNKVLILLILHKGQCLDSVNNIKIYRKRMI